MAKGIVDTGREDDKSENATAYDLVLAVSPDDWGAATQEEKAVLALSPIASFVLILEAEKSDFSVNNLDAARVIKALLDRAEVILGIPGQGFAGCVKAREVSHV
ncbi:hypothetical protein DSECCO2_565000 [anaerobic digester metagenome]